MKLCKCDLAARSSLTIASAFGVVSRRGIRLVVGKVSGGRSKCVRISCKGAEREQKAC